MVTPKSPSVIVLWDLETCLPGDTSAGDAASVVAKIATLNGNIKTFKAFYLSNPPDREPGIQPSYLQALQMKGIDPVDCTFLAGDSVEVMTIEMFTEVIDGGYHNPPTIIIISSRASLEYASEKLRHKNLKVITFKSWEEVNEASKAVNDLPDSPPIAIGEDVGPDLTEGIDRTLAMSHVDPVAQRRFHVIIDVLWDSMAKGEARVSRADIGNMLIRRDANVYQDAQFGGKSAFRSYVATAEERGVIRSGGGGSEAWVELRTSGADNLAPGVAN
ncbi:hypothetical protein NMY22_g5777 [Coprinellus aureogranulatus]|nr:hypothetical protein NMY22_g5777 [Coprinellus aureogranulatus]